MATLVVKLKLNQEPSRRGADHRFGGPLPYYGVRHRRQALSEMEVREEPQTATTAVCVTGALSGARMFYNDRRAAATGRTAAWIAGNNPPATPMARAKTIPPSRRSGVIRK